MRCYVTEMPWLVFTNVYVALCGAALTAATGCLLGLPVRIDHTSGLVFCCTLVIYNLDRLVEPNPGESEHEQWVERHLKFLWVLTACSAIAAVYLSTRLSHVALISLPIAGVVAIGYCLPVLPYRGRWYRLKAVPGAKLLLIALVWTYATAGLPMLESGITLNSSNAMILLTRFFFIAAVALPFDLPDMQRDQRSGIKTIPTLLGIRATRSVAWGLVIASAFTAILTPWPAASALLISCACTAGLISMLSPQRGVFYFMVALDGMLLVQAGLLWACSG